MECRETEVTDPNTLPRLDPSSKPSQQDAGQGEMMREAGAGASDAALDGSVDMGDSGMDGSTPIVPNQPVAPTTTGFATLGARRTDGALTVYDDGFEKAPRTCTGNGLYCVTGGFEP